MVLSIKSKLLNAPKSDQFQLHKNELHVSDYEIHLDLIYTLAYSRSLNVIIVRVLLLVRFTPSLVQSISGVGKPLNEHLNWSDELYVTDWFLSSGLIPGGPGHRINKKNSKKAKVCEKNIRKWEDQQMETKVSQHLPVPVIWKTNSFFPSFF